MHIPVLNHSGHPLPAYQTPHAAGLDLRAHLPGGPVTLAPLERQLIPTGLSLEIPVGYEGQVRPRSGLAVKHGIGLVNSPGTIDADYRGEVRVLLVNGGTFEAKTATHAQQWGGMGLMTLEGHPGTWTTYALTPITVDN